MILIKDENRNMYYLAIDGKTACICPFKAPIVVQVENNSNLITGQPKGPQMVQTMQNCNTSCPHLNEILEGYTETTIRLINKIDQKNFEGLNNIEIDYLNDLIQKRKNAANDIEMYGILIDESMYLKHRKPTAVEISCTSFNKINL